MVVLIPHEVTPRFLLLFTASSERQRGSFAAVSSQHPQPHARMLSTLDKHWSWRRRYRPPTFWCRTWSEQPPRCQTAQSELRTKPDCPGLYRPGQARTVQNGILKSQRDASTASISDTTILSFQERWQSPGSVTDSHRRPEPLSDHDRNANRCSGLYGFYLFVMSRMIMARSFALTSMATPPTTAKQKVSTWTFEVGPGAHRAVRKHDYSSIEVFLLVT